ncbi:hypothetical protein D3C71_1831930 [compost metagenome]
MTRETTKATTIPTTSVTNSSAVKVKPNLASLSTLAPSMVGTARKKVNSAAAVLATPSINAPIIVAPEREVPGKTAAINWKIPMYKTIR